MSETQPSMQQLPLQVQRFAMVQFMSLVPVPVADLERVVDRALEENPALQRGSRRSCSTCGAGNHGRSCPLRGGVPVDADDRADDDDWRDALAQGARWEVHRRLHPLVDRIVAGLDDHGLLPEPVVDEPADDVAAALDAIRLVGPLGVAATSPLDCVRVQAQTLVARGEAPVELLRVVLGWLPEVAEGRLEDIARQSGLSLDAVETCVALIRRRLRPFVLLPGTGPRSGPVDVIFSRRADPDPGVDVHVPDAAALGLSLDHTASALGPEARAWLAPHRAAAVRLLSAIDARAWMLTRVAEVLVREQAPFVLQGPSAHRTLRRQDVAHELGVHPSTVGRTVAGKVARTPDGRVIALEDFFGAVTSTRERVRAALAELPGASDARVAEHLRGSGTVIARRTVAKYRGLARPQV